MRFPRSSTRLLQRVACSALDHLERMPDGLILVLFITIITFIISLFIPEMRSNILAELWGVLGAGIVIWWYLSNKDERLRNTLWVRENSTYAQLGLISINSIGKNTIEALLDIRQTDKDISLLTNGMTKSSRARAAKYLQTIVYLSASNEPPNYFVSRYKYTLIYKLVKYFDNRISSNLRVRLHKTAYKNLFERKSLHVKDVVLQHRIRQIALDSRVVFSSFSYVIDRVNDLRSAVGEYESAVSEFMNLYDLDLDYVYRAGSTGVLVGAISESERDSLVSTLKSIESQSAIKLGFAAIRICQACADGLEESGFSVGAVTEIDDSMS